MLAFAYPILLYLLVPALGVVAYARFRWYKGARYRYALASNIEPVRGLGAYRNLFVVLRTALMLVLAVLLARPRLVDQRSEINIEGIDIVLVVDVSGQHEPSAPC